MQFTTVFTLAFATFAAAAPAAVGDSSSTIQPVGNQVTVGQAGDKCGTDFDLSCCNKADVSGDATNVASGIAGGLLQGAFGKEGLGLFDGCSKLDITAGIVGGGVSDLLNSQCKQTAACCQRSGSEQNGLLNVGLPCVALGGLL
ncbi:Rodlet protein [Apiospora kogelbergensis]|uniref:Hydrophobin n=1 Tax=Apiospora kogelbergensis TaxID=1337665 RepID=A0AAW0QG40_9PEZI